MKWILACLLVFAGLSSPLLAAKKSTVTFRGGVAVGSIQIKAGEYKLSYEGEGPIVKVTLAREGASPIVLNAKLLPTANPQPAVTYSFENGVRTLRQIDMGKASLLFEGSQPNP